MAIQLDAAALKEVTRRTMTGCCPTAIRFNSAIAILVSLTIVFSAIHTISAIAFGIQLKIILVSAGIWLLVSALIVKEFHKYVHSGFGAANTVTSVRAMCAALLFGLIPIAESLQSMTNAGWMWLITVLAILTVMLDGLDGYLARKYNTQSTFGARFDMEVDALLALIIALFLWQSNKVGIWILGLGIMRYAFIAAAHWIEALRNELYPSRRRKVVCVIQLLALCSLLCPVIDTPHSTTIAALALICLALSFIIDIRWLLQQSSSGSI
ncbi:MAG: CDP-alcohol phosphatidyltransferase family protein [Granulosicoccus sp.]|nr:CDP-alcohol phosphatidyltransferase family protein [Granulosicoccus sp.]